MLKAFLVFFIIAQSIMLGSTDSFAQKMNYFTNYEEALQEGVKKYKPLMFIVETTTCPWCKKLENQVLSKENINAIIQTNFVPLILNRDKDNYPKKLFEAKGVPTTFFIDPLTQKILHKVRGYKSKKAFTKELNTAKNIYYKGK